MILKILKYPNPILREKAEEVKELTPEIRKLIEDMVESMEKNNGAGLSAPQVGELKRIIVIGFEESPEVFINPEILSESKETEVIGEGCLSFPSLYLNIKRAKEIEIKALDTNGTEIRIKAKGLIAGVLQHEIDHLDGILFIDHVRVGRRIWELFKFYLGSKK